MTAATPTLPLNRIGWDVERLTIPTNPPANITGRARGIITREPLLTALRDAIRPDQGSTGSGRSAASSSRLPIDPDALTLYEDITGQIAAIYEMGTDRTATGTPEQLLTRWWIAFLATPDKPAAMLDNYADKLAGWRRRIENHFTRPREQQFAGCPACGYTHYLIPIDGEYVQRRTLTAVWWPDHPERGRTVTCGYCHTRWTDRTDELIDARPLEHLAHELEQAGLTSSRVTENLAPLWDQTPNHTDGGLS